MTDTPSEERPIVRLSRVSVAFDLPRGRRRKHEPPPPGSNRDYIVYGVDADGNEREYARHATEEEHRAWKATDPLWHEAQSAIIGRLLDDPATRDWVIELNALAAYEKGDIDTAAELLQHLSTEEWNRLTSRLGKDGASSAEIDQRPSRDDDP